MYVIYHISIDARESESDEFSELKMTRIKEDGNTEQYNFGEGEIIINTDKTTVYNFVLYIFIAFIYAHVTK